MRRVVALLLALAPAAYAQDLTQAQPELGREKLTIVTHDGKPHDFSVEVARTPAQQQVGLMWRKAVAPDQGMLFPWPREQRSTMWMKNTLAPLDMVFIGGDGTIRAIAEDTTPRSLATVDSGVPVAATLELAAGTAARLDLRVGDHVSGAGFAAP